MAVMVLVEVVAKPDCLPMLVQSLERGLPQTREASGCRDIHTYCENSTRSVVAVEHWDSKEDYERYLAWRVETGVMAALERLLEAPPNIRFLEPLEA